MADQAAYDNKMRLFIADVVIFFALFIVLLEKHPLAGSSDGKSTKVKKESKK